MNLPENDYQILKLTTRFYEEHPDPPYHEILKRINGHTIVYCFNHIMIIIYVCHTEAKYHIHILLSSKKLRDPKAIDRVLITPK